MHQALELYDENINKRRTALKSTSDILHTSDTPNVSILVEPASLIAVIKVVAALYKMKTEADGANRISDALKEIGNKLDAINSRLGGISKQLNEVIERLDKLGIAIEDVPYKVVLVQQRGLIRHIALHAQEWAKSVSTPRTKEQVQDALTDLNRFDLSLIDGGFAYSIDILLGFAVELDLQILLGAKASSFKAVVKYFLDYIDRALDLGQPKSMAERLDFLSKRLLLLEVEDKKLDRSKIYLGRKFINNCHSDGHWSYSESYCTLTGDVKSGYEIRRSGIDREGFCDSSYNQPSYDYTIDCPNVIKNLDAKHQDYFINWKHKEVLQQIMKKMEEIRENISDRIKWHEKAIG